MSHSAAKFRKKIHEYRNLMTKISDFYENFEFSQKIRILTKILNFDENFQF